MRFWGKLSNGNYKYVLHDLFLKYVYRKDVDAMICHGHICEYGMFILCKLILGCYVIIITSMMHEDFYMPWYNL